MRNSAHAFGYWPFPPPCYSLSLYIRNLLIPPTNNPESRARAGRSDPFCHGCRHLTEIGNFPFNPMTGQRDLPLPRQRGTGATQPHPLAALPGFLTFERAVSRNVHRSKLVCFGR